MRVDAVSSYFAKVGRMLKIASVITNKRKPAGFLQDMQILPGTQKMLATLAISPSGWLLLLLIKLFSQDELSSLKANREKAFIPAAHQITNVNHNYNDNHYHKKHNELQVLFVMKL